MSAQPGASHLRRLMWMLAAASVLVAACGGDSATPAPATAAPTSPAATGAPAPSAAPVAVVDLFDTAYVPDSAETGGSIIIGDWQEATELNPYYASRQTDANVASLVWHSLLTVSNDARYVPQLAATPLPTTSNDGVTVGMGGDAMTVTWKLRDGLTWSDGHPLTCDDFRYAWEWVLTEGNVASRAGFEDITEVECPTATDMIWHFDSVFEGYLTLMKAPLPRHALSLIPMTDQVGGVGFRPDELAAMPVSGPFAFASVTPGADLRLVRNDNYANPRSGRVANLDKVNFAWYADATAMVAGFRAGQVDLAFGLKDADILQLRDLGDEVVAVTGAEYELLRLNWSPATDFDASTRTGGCSRNAAVSDRGDGCPMADPAMRAAVASAIDKEEITTRLLGDSVEVASTGISPWAWFSARQASPAFDPITAGSVLDAARWVRGPDGIRAKDGVTARIELCTTAGDLREDAMRLIASRLKAVGIDTVINAVDPADMFAGDSTVKLETPCALSTSNFDIAAHALRTSIDPLGIELVYSSARFRPDGANDARVNDADIDAALETVRNSVDVAVIKDAMTTFQELYVEKTVEIPLYYRTNVELAGPRIGNFFANGTGAGSAWNAEDWFARG